MSISISDLEKATNEELAAMYQNPGTSKHVKSMIADQARKNCKSVIWANIKRVGKAFDKEDLYNAGVIGVMRALEKFDPSHGATFKTYAHNWVFSEIAAEANNASGVKMGDADGLRIRTSGNKTAALLSQRLGREPTVEELAEELGVKQESIVSSRACRNFISLSTPSSSSEDDGGTIGDLIESNEIDSETVLHQKRTLELIQEFSNSLNEKQRTIFFHVIIEGGFAAEVGRQYDISRARAVQIRGEVETKFAAFCKKHKIEESSFVL